MKYADLLSVTMKWLKACRLHTMGLSFAVILAGSAQVGWQNLQIDILALSLFCAAGFQLISNFANDYGDFIKGTDTERPEAYRSLSAGNFSAAQVRAAIVLLIVVTLLAVIALVWRCSVSLSGKWTMFFLGIASVIAALTYTLGKRPYGYYALGDIMVFLFFGVLGVVGSYYMQDGQLNNLSVGFLAIAFGALSTSVLNINNIRDCDKDKRHHKKTIANWLGKEKALRYQQFLFVIALFFFLFYAIKNRGLSFLLVTVALYCIWLIHRQLIQAQTHSDYNRCLAMTVKYTLLLSLPTCFLGLYLF